MDLDNSKINEFIKKVGESKQNQLDLSSDEDLSIAIMNLVSIEEHFFFTGAKTGDSKYFDLLKIAREMRKELLGKIVKDVEAGSERWCISKHLLSASMRLMEVGTKALGQDKKQEAEDLFKKSYELYSLFWGLNLKMIDLGEVKKIGEDQIDKNDNKPASAKASAGEAGVMAKLGKMVKYVIDCCKE